MLVTIPIVLLILGIIVAVPAWLHSDGWGLYLSGVLGLILLIFLVFTSMGSI